MSEQLFLRDDVIEFSNKLDMEGFNVKAYRKRKSTTGKKNSVLNPSTQCGLSQENILNINRSMEKAGINIQKLSDIRISATAAIRKRKDLSEDLSNQNRSINVRTQISTHKRQESTVVQTAKINYDSHRKNSFKQTSTIKQQPQNAYIRISNIQPPKVNKFVQITKKHNRGNIINQKYLENWLDQVLIQYCQQEKFDKTIQNPALKKMGLDRNSLLSQGIKPEHINRVYKTMFVYSIGFNNLLKELAGKNMNLRKTVWKVYAILLQYCAQGTFQTMIGQIQRDKARKLQSLREQIEKRQKVIQNNDQINEEKNAKIFKELKVLREQNTNLQNEKNVLLQDFKQAEQSFNQEVSLRLKFQNKINQIHGVHHQLATKHNRLYTDYHKKTEELDTLQLMHIKLNQSFLINKQKMEGALQELQMFKKQNEYYKEQISNLQQIRLRFQNFEIQQKNNKEDLQNIIKQKLRKVSQLQVELQNSDIMLKMKSASSKQLQLRYRQSLEENKKLNNTIREQINQLNQLFSEKKQFSDKHLSYVAEIQFLKNKDSQNKITIQRLKKNINEDQEYKDKITVQNTILEQKVAMLTHDLNECMENIQNMKRTKNLFEDQLNYVKKRVELHGQVVRQKDQLVNQLSKKLQRISKQNEQYITLNKTLDSKTTVLSQKLRSQQEMSRKKYEKLKQERDELFKQNGQHNAVLQQKVQQLEKYRSLYDSQTLNLKNQRFQRVNLDLRYKQSLQVMQSENQHIRNLNIVISQNKEQIQQLNRKNRNTEYVLRQKQRLYQVEIKQLNSHLDQTRKQLNKKKMFVNPMILQDFRGLLQRQIQKTVRLKKQIESHIKERKKMQHQNLKNLNSLKQAQAKQLFQTKQTLNKKIQDKEYELQYQKQKSKHLSQKTNQLQILIQGLNSSQQNQSVKALKQRQKKYLSTIKQKSEQIEKLLKQLQNAHDHNNTIMKRLSQIDSIIAKKDQQITKLQQTVQKMHHQIQQKDKSISGGSYLKQRQKQSSNSNDYPDDQQNLPSLSIIDQRKDLNSKKRVNSRAGNNNEHGGNNKNGSSSSNKKTSKQQTEQQTQRSNKKVQTQKIVNPVWRNDFSKKLKNALNYYKN